MATSMFVNIRTTKLNQSNRFMLTHKEAGKSWYGGPLFSFYLTDDEVDELETLVVRFAEKISEAREQERDARRSLPSQDEN